MTNSQGISAQSAADHYGFGGDLNCGEGYRFVASDGGSSTSATPASTAAPVARR